MLLPAMRVIVLALGCVVLDCVVLLGRVVGIPPCRSKGLQQVLGRDAQLPLDQVARLSESLFGSTDYNEWYFQDIAEAAKGLKERIAALPRGAKFFYQASW